MALAEAEQERVWFAREVFNLFVKCFTTLKLYPHDHVHCITSLKEFSKRLRAFVKLHEVLRISVKQDRLVVEGKAVYETETSTENLAFRLYVDGLREVSVTRNVSVEEAKKLAFIFYQAIVDQDADATLLFWEANLTNIDYVALNSLTEAWESPEYFSSEHFDLLQAMNRDALEIADALNQEVEPGLYSFELSERGRELDMAEGLEDHTQARDDESGDIFDVSEEELAGFRREVQSWGPDRLLKTFVEHALDGFALLPAILDAESIRWLLQEAMHLALRSQDMELLGDLLVRFEGEQELTEEEEAEEVFLQAFAWLGQEENVDRLVKLAQGGALGGPKAFCRILGKLGPGGLRAAVLTTLENSSRELKLALTGFMEAQIKAGADPSALEPLLTPDRPAQIVHDGLFVLSKGKPSPAMTQLLTAARAHADPKVKEYAAHLWKSLTVEGRMQGSMDGLSAKTREDRVRALKALIRAKERRGVKRLREIIEEPIFLQRDAQEREAFIQALRYLGGPAMSPFLKQQTRRKTLLFNRKATKEIRDMAQRALEDLSEGKG